MSCCCCDCDECQDDYVPHDGSVQEWLPGFEPAPRPYSKGISVAQLMQSFEDNYRKPMADESWTTLAMLDLLR